MVASLLLLLLTIRTWKKLSKTMRAILDAVVKCWFYCQLDGIKCCQNNQLVKNARVVKSWTLSQWEYHYSVHPRLNQYFTYMILFKAVHIVICSSRASETTLHTSLNCIRILANKLHILVYSNNKLCWKFFHIGGIWDTFWNTLCLKIFSTREGNVCQRSTDFS